MMWLVIALLLYFEGGFVYMGLLGTTVSVGTIPRWVLVLIVLFWFITFPILIAIDTGMPDPDKGKQDES